MKSTVDKQVVITLELTPEEFNTIFVTFGVTSHNQRVESAVNHGLNILSDKDDSHRFYKKLEDISDSVKRIV